MKVAFQVFIRPGTHLRIPLFENWHITPIFVEDCVLMLLPAKVEFDLIQIEVYEFDLSK